MFWWPAPGNFALLLILTEVLLSPTASQTLRATTLYQASCCYSLSLFPSEVFNPSFVSVLVCSVRNTDGRPTLSSPELCFFFIDNSHVEKSEISQSYAAAMCGLLMRRNSTVAIRFGSMFPFVGSTFHAFFPMSEVYYSTIFCRPLEKIKTDSF